MPAPFHSTSSGNCRQLSVCCGCIHYTVLRSNRRKYKPHEYNVQFTPQCRPKKHPHEHHIKYINELTIELTIHFRDLFYSNYPFLYRLLSLMIFLVASHREPSRLPEHDRRSHKQQKVTNIQSFRKLILAQSREQFAV